MGKCKEEICEDVKVEKKKNLREVLTHSPMCFLYPLGFTSHRVEIAGENQVNKENKRFLDVTTCVRKAECLMTKAFSSGMCTLRSSVLWA